MLVIVDDVKDLIDIGTEFLPDQEFLVVDGHIDATPLVLIKDATALVDIMQLGDPTFVASLPLYNGPALYSPVGTVTYGPTMPLVGDYNGNGIVDAADYVLWRKNPSAFGGDPAGYNTWRANFGASLGNGALSNQAVPEPARAVLLTLGAAIAIRRGRRSTQPVPGPQSRVTYAV